MQKQNTGRLSDSRIASGEGEENPFMLCMIIKVPTRMAERRKCVFEKMLIEKVRTSRVQNWSTVLVLMSPPKRKKDIEKLVRLLSFGPM